MYKIRLVFLVVFLITCVKAYAADYAIIRNQTAYLATINPGGDDNWRRGDLYERQILNPYETKIFRFRIVTSNAILGINIEYGNIKGHVEFWRDHSYTTQVNVKTMKDIVYKDIGYTYGIGTDTPLIKTELLIAHMAGWLNPCETNIFFVFLTINQ